MKSFTSNYQDFGTRDSGLGMHPASRIPHPAIGIVTWDYHPAKGGMGRTMQWMADALVGGGMRVCVAPFLGFTRRLGGHLMLSLLLPFVLQRWIDKEGVKLLLVPAGPGGILLLKKPKRCRVLVNFHHTYRQQARCVPRQWWKRIFIPLERRMCRMADALCCFSMEVQDVLTEDERISPAKVTVIPQAIAIERWRPSASVNKEEGLCVCVARLEQRKGVEVLLHAWVEVLKACPSARLVIVGDGILRRRIDCLISGLGGSAERHSSLSEEELTDLVQRSELALCPSYLEGFGLAAAEAMAAGTAVVASDVDGLRSLIAHGETGWLVPPGDSEKWAQAIVHLLSDKSLREVLAERGQDEVVQKYDRARSERALQELVASLL